jgi:pyruvate kinase
MLDLEHRAAPALQGVASDHHLSARNLIHYVAMRRLDLRGLETALASLGLSSIERSEPRGLWAVNRLIEIADALSGTSPDSAPVDAPCDIGSSKKLLDKHTRSLLPHSRKHRHARIMVTVPGTAANDYKLIQALLANGMDCMRIDCAHDAPATWLAMIQHLDKARRALDVDCAVFMDLAGPGIRTGTIEAAPAVIKVRPLRDAYGRVTRAARLWISGADSVAAPGADAVIHIDAKWLAGLAKGNKIRFLDTRGRRRRLDVVDIKRGGVWAVLTRTAYFTNGTTLTRTGTHKHSSTKSDVFGIDPGPGTIPLSTGDTLIITSDSAPGRARQLNSMGQARPARVPCTLPEALTRVDIGHRISLDEGRIRGVVEAASDDEIRVRIDFTPADAQLRAGQDIDFPDSNIKLPAVAAENAAILDFVGRHADFVGLSLVNHERGVQALVDRLNAMPGTSPGIVVKIDARRGFERLPGILLSAMQLPRYGVMIARGDFAAGCGHERLPELQEEILRMCEAAHCPVICAAEALESGKAMSERADCVLLNEGPHLDALRALDQSLERRSVDAPKSRATLRSLKLARDFDAYAKPSSRRVNDSDHPVPA